MPGSKAARWASSQADSQIETGVDVDSGKHRHLLGDLLWKAQFRILKNARRFAR